MDALRKEAMERDKIKKTVPHLLLILDNPMTSGLVPFAINEGVDTVAGPNTQEGVSVVLKGQAKDSHAIFRNNEGIVTITPSEGAPAMVNGKSIEGEVELQHNDRLRFGENNWFRFIIPSVLETLSAEQREQDDHKYDFTFMKEEAMEEAIKRFEIDGEENEELRQKAIDLQMQQREADLAASKKEMEAFIAAEREKQQAHLAELEKQLEAEREVAEEELKAATREKRREILEQNKKKAKEIRAKMMEEKKKLQLEMNQRQDELRVKLKEEKKARDILKRQEEEERKKKEHSRTRLYYDIMDSLTPVRQVNEYAKEMGTNSEFKIVITKSQNNGSIVNAVTVEVRDRKTGIKELWNMEQFRANFGVLVQEYTDNYSNIKRGQSVKLKPYSPYKVNPRAPQAIGHTHVSLSYLYHLMEINDSFPLTDYEGNSRGKLMMSMKIIWPNAEIEEKMEDYEDLKDTKEIRKLDIEFNIKQCVDLPSAKSAAVRCVFSFPNWISTQLLPDDYMEKLKADQEREAERAEAAAKGTAESSDDDDDDYDDDEFEDEKDEEELDNTQRGGFYQTDFMLEEEGGRVTVNPIINWVRVIRVTLTKKVKDWLSQNELPITVMGVAPANTIPKQNDNTTKEKKEKITPEEEDEDDEGKKLLMEAQAELEAVTLKNASLEKEHADFQEKLELARGLEEKVKRIQQEIIEHTKDEEEAKVAVSNYKEALQKAEEARSESQALFDESNDQLNEENKIKAKSADEIKKKLNAANQKQAQANNSMKKARAKANDAAQATKTAEKKGREAVSRKLQALENEKLLLRELERLDARIAEQELALSKKSKTCVLL